MASVITKERAKRESTPLNFRALEEARNAVATLRALKPMLSKRDEETLSILMDKELTNLLDKSLREARAGKLEPLSSILK